MKNLNRDIRKRNKKKNERGVALFLALFALLLLSAIAMGMMFLSTTETQVNYNYRDAQRAYFASQAGLELIRDAMRDAPELVPVNLPSTTNATGIFYILNPGKGETIDPTDAKSKYFDYELCHEYGTELGISGVADWKTPCSSGAPSGSYTIINTMTFKNPEPPQVTMIKNGDFSQMSFRWVRISLKQNKATPYTVNTSASYDRQQVCWDDDDFSQHIINVEGAQATPNVPGPEGPLSGPELAAARKLAESGAGEPAIFAFGAKGKSTTTTGTSTTGTSTTGTSTTGTSTTGTSTTGTSTTGTSTTGTSTTGTSTTGTSTTGTSTTGTSTTGTSTTGTSTTGTSTTGTSTTTTGGGTGGGGGSSGGGGSTGGGGKTTTTTTGGYYSAIDNCQNSLQDDRFSVYLITSMAVTPTGARRLTQFEVSRHPFPPIPGGLTFNGPGPNFYPPDSVNFQIDGHDHAVDDTAKGGSCKGPKSPVHAITARGAQSAQDIKDDIINNTNGLGDHYTGLGTDALAPSDDPKQNPDVVDGLSPDPLAGNKVWLDKFDTVSENEDMVNTFSDSADTLALKDPAFPSGYTDKTLPVKDPTCASYPFGSDYGASGVPSACQGPKVTVVKDDLSLSAVTGTGILVVTGKLTLKGNFGWNGLILVIGKGQLEADGGGNKSINGGVYVAQTRDPSTSALLGSLGNPDVTWKGGGTNELLYNSCKLSDALGGSRFRVVTYREISY